MRRLARELVVDDETKAAIVKLEELWMDDNRWDVYLPPGQFRLCVATRAIGDDGLAPVVASRPVGPGRHTIGLTLRKEKAGWSVEASCDGAKPVTAEEPLAWNADKGSTTIGGFSESTTLPATVPIILHRCTFLTCSLTASPAARANRARAFCSGSSRCPARRGTVDGSWPDNVD